MAKKSDPATNDDVRQIVSEIVGEVANETLTVMAEHLEAMERRVKIELRAEIRGSAGESGDRSEARYNRLENILRPTADSMDDHEVRLKRLEARPTEV